MNESELNEACWEERKVVRINAAGRHRINDRIIREESLSLFINGVLANTFACSPADLEALAVGWAFTQGYFRNKKDIESVSLDKESRAVSLTLRKNNGNINSMISRELPEEEAPKDITLSHEDIYALWKTFDAQCILYQSTGAAHAMALTDGKQILMLTEDVSRRNALIKIIGKIVLNGIDTWGKALLVSSRLAFDMFRMIESTELKLVLCNGAVSSGAVIRAAEARITLVGFIKRGNMNIYCHDERVS
ncbi:formate dehydrogenase accessory sulfurtransferase FdhD [Treponema endosymbiont of Eucomonympha sp.]|uniref:formate dehydrogenase accessory sulfurtransferase FdhD n=1 Tax=Treponema endosymbiont of Eucomonympha sp. TaxID=1580831 RepID=UPI000750DF94|nr:formate dehydrogenase accessory sulfurtransferase FdhD [Treponema endosymbiont of Eucomonympha sp.]